MSGKIVVLGLWAKLILSLQYCKKEVNDEVDFLHTDNHGSFLQIYTMIFDGDGQAF